MCHTVLNTPCCLQWVQRSRLHDLSHLDCSNTSQHSSFNQAAFACCVRPQCLLLALECNDNALPRMQTRQISELRCASALGLRLCTSLELMTCLLCVNISCLLLCVRSEPARSPLLSVVPERLCANMPCNALHLATLSLALSRTYLCGKHIMLVTSSPSLRCCSCHSTPNNDPATVCNIVSVTLSTHPSCVPALT